MVEFKIEDKYLVIKLSDTDKYLNEGDKLNIACCMDKINRGRAADDKPLLECLVAEKDWPEYKLLLDALQKRVENG